jgi:hypothetical protein
MLSKLAVASKKIVELANSVLQSADILLSADNLLSPTKVGPL